MNNLSYFLDTCPSYIKSKFINIWWFQKNIIISVYQLILLMKKI